MRVIQSITKRPRGQVFTIDNDNYYLVYWDTLKSSYQ